MTTPPRSGDLLTAGPIVWPVDSPCGSTGPDGVSAVQWTRAQALATEWLWVLSGRRFGLVDVVYRPEWTIWDRMRPPRMILGGPAWPGVFPSSLRTDEPLTRAPLPGPVSSVTAVTVDNVTLAGSGQSYIQEGDYIVRTDGGQWYRYQDTTQPISDAGTWQVEYQRGLTVPAGGQFAVGVLACEMAAAMASLTCRLPNNTVSVVRNGVNISIDAKQLQMGYTGLREVDQWCRLVNPKNRPSDSEVWSPDTDATRQRPIPTASNF